MKSCTDCKHAEWKRNAAGNLHPSGDGKCTMPYKVPRLPACMYWMSSSGPVWYGGSINRHEELKDHCTYYTRSN